MQVFIVLCSAVVGFLSVLIGRWLHLDYSTKLWAMTFVLVVMVRSTYTSMGKAMCPLTEVPLKPYIQIESHNPAHNFTRQALGLNVLNSSKSNRTTGGA